MKKKTKQSKPISPYVAKNKVGIKLPPFFEPEQVHFLVQRVNGSARNETERRVFRAILRRAYEDTMELEILYNELPGVINGDREALRNFRNILTQAAMHVKSGAAPRVRVKSKIGSLKSPLPTGGFPCKQSFLINPSKVLLIAETISQLDFGDKTLVGKFLDATRGLLRRTRYIELFYRQALFGADKTGRDRLAEHLRLIARNSIAKADPFQAGSAGSPDRKGFPRFMPGLGPGGGLPDPGGLWPPPDPGGLWPPPDPGSLVVWPPDGFGDPGIKPDACELLAMACQELGFDGIMDAIAHPPSSEILSKGTTSAEGITGIVPRSACAGQTIKILGSGFGTTQPPDVGVLIGSKIVEEVISWSDEEIVIRIPAGTKSGCVGFLNWTHQAKRVKVLGEVQSATRDRMLAMKCLGIGEIAHPPVVLEPMAPCNGYNYFEGTLPEIEHFYILHDGFISPRLGTSAILTLSWEVRNAINVEIKRISSTGPNINVLNPPGSTLTLGIFNGPQGAVARYELAATNNCGTVRRTTEITFGLSTPHLRIAGIEVVQVIQRFDHINPDRKISIPGPFGFEFPWNNSVALVAGKQTMVRVYIDPGYIFNNLLQPNVTGKLSLEIPEGLISGVQGIRPLNAGQVTTARPVNQIDRNDMCHTLNFELPYGMLVGQIKITADVWVKDHEDENTSSGWRTVSSTEVRFYTRREQKVVRMLVQDNNLGLAAPTNNQYFTTLQGARIRFPIAYNGLPIYIAPGYETIVTNRNLTTNDGWEDLLDDIEDVASDFEDIGQVWTAITPDDSSYSLNGIGTASGDSPCLAVQTGLQATFAHELAHTFGVGHADCGNPLNVDDRLPVGTEDIGMDVNRRLPIPANTRELMTYCTPNWGGMTSCGAAYPNATYQDRWPSIALWNILLNDLG